MLGYELAVHSSHPVASGEICKDLTAQTNTTCEFLNSVKITPFDNHERRRIV